MAKQPEDLTLRILKDIQATQADHSRRFDRVDERFDRMEKRLADLSKVLRYSMGQNAETEFRQSQQESRVDELFRQLEKLFSDKQPT